MFNDVNILYYFDTYLLR